MTSEVNPWEINKARWYVLFVYENHVEQAVVHFGAGGKVHPSAGVASIGDDNTEERIGRHVFAIDFDGHHLFTVAGGRGHSRETKPQKTAKPLMMRLESLDNNGCYSLLALIQKKLLVNISTGIDYSHSAEVHDPLSITACDFNLLVCMSRQVETAQDVLGRATADNTQLAGRVDGRSMGHEAVDNLVYRTVTPDGDYEFGPSLDSRSR
jgi:hypothetical protein